VLEGSVDGVTFTGLIEGLASNENYDVRVRGVNDNGPGNWSNVATGSTLIYPGEIDDLVVLFTTADSATVSWTPPDDATSYESRHSVTTLETWSSPAELETVVHGTKLRGVIDDDFTVNETYDFQVRGMNDNGDGEWSNIVTALVSDLVPSTIDDLEVISATDTSATLQFTEPTEPGAESFEYQFSLAGADDWSSPAALSGTSDEGVFTGTVSSGLTTGETYDFQVRGVNPAGEAEWSNTATRTILDFAEESLAAFAVMEDEPSTARKIAYDTFIQALLDGGVWERCDLIYLFAAHHEQAARVNLKTPGSFTATAINSPTFTVDVGFTGESAEQRYLSAGFNVASASGKLASQDDAHLSVYLHTNIAANSDIPSGLATANIENLWIAPRRGSTNVVRSNLFGEGSNDFTLSPVTSVGHTLVTRGSSTSVQCYKDGVSIGEVTRASAAPFSANLSFLRAGSGYSAHQIAVGTFGRHLTGEQVTVLHDAIVAYLAAIE
jgi:hypothetical protein